jgi:hypothetical protein
MIGASIVTGRDARQARDQRCEKPPEEATFCPTRGSMETDIHLI